VVRRKCLHFSDIRHRTPNMRIKTQRVTFMFPIIFLNVDLAPTYLRNNIFAIAEQLRSTGKLETSAVGSVNWKMEDVCVRASGHVLFSSYTIHSIYSYFSNKAILRPRNNEEYIIREVLNNPEGENKTSVGPKCGIYRSQKWRKISFGVISTM
jgi:hypothetical protein